MTVNRTAANPLDVLVLTDLALPVPLNGTLDAAKLEPNVADRMLAAGGIVVENPTDAAAAYPELWATRAAAKSALQRGMFGAFPYTYSYGGMHPTSADRLQSRRAGAVRCSGRV